MGFSTIAPAPTHTRSAGAEGTEGDSSAVRHARPRSFPVPGSAWIAGWVTSSTPDPATWKGAGSGISADLAAESHRRGDPIPDANTYHAAATPGRATEPSARAVIKFWARSSPPADWYVRAGTGQYTDPALPAGIQAWWDGHSTHGQTAVCRDHSRYRRRDWPVPTTRNSGFSLSSADSRPSHFIARRIWCRGARSGDQHAPEEANKLKALAHGAPRGSGGVCTS